MEDENLINPWDDTSYYNFEKNNPAKKKFNEFLSFLETPPCKKQPKQSTQSMTDRYRLAWKQIYNSLPLWRQKEIDRAKNGELTRWDKDFIQQVASLAESNTPLEA